METMRSREVYANPWMRVREDEIRRADGSDGIYGVVDKPDYALVIPYDGDRLHLIELTAGPCEREHEEQDMRSAWFPRTEFESMVRRDEVCDAQSLAAYALLLLHERTP